MLNQRDIARLKETIEALEPPVLSVYLPIEPRPNDQAAGLRLNSAIRAIEAPDSVARAVRERVAELNHSGTAMVFATEDRVDAITVDVEVPFDDPGADRPPAAWGAPMRAPLYWMLGQGRFGILFIDGDRARMFESFLGAIEERWVEDRGLVPGQDDHLQQSKQVHPAFVPSRGGGAKDAAEDHDEVWRERFFHDVAARVAASAEALGLDRLIVLGPEGAAPRFVRALPEPLRRHVAAELSSLSHAEASPAAVLQHCRAAIEADGERRRRELLDAIDERGIGGVKECGRELRMGRVKSVVIAWQLDPHARESAVREALGHGSEIFLLSDEAGEELMRKHGGMAALLRW